MRQTVKENVQTVIVGKDVAIDCLLTALLVGGHILLEDVPGTGKTTLAKAFAASLSCDFSRIQFTPDLLPSDVTGINYYNRKEEEFVLRKGPVFTNVLLADEINRATPRTQSALLECMEEHQVTIDGVTHPLPAPFLVIATENPVETTGTFPLPEAQLDRFLMRIPMAYPSREEELAIMDRFAAEDPLTALKPICTEADILRMRKEYRNVFLHDSLKEYILDIVTATRSNSKLLLGVSPRATLALQNCAKAYAYLQGRSYVTPEDIHFLAVPVLAHRLRPDRGITPDATRANALMSSILETVPVPTEEYRR